MTQPPSRLRLQDRKEAIVVGWIQQRLDISGFVEHNELIVAAEFALHLEIRKVIWSAIVNACLLTHFFLSE